MVCVESQNKSAVGQDGVARYQLLVQSDRALHDLNHLYYIQHDKISPTTKQPPSMGTRHIHMAPNHAALCRLRLLIHVCTCLPRLLERRTQTRREGRYLLLDLRGRILHL